MWFFSGMPTLAVSHFNKLGKWRAILWIQLIHWHEQHIIFQSLRDPWIDFRVHSRAGQGIQLMWLSETISIHRAVSRFPEDVINYWIGLHVSSCRDYFIHSSQISQADLLFSCSVFLQIYLNRQVDFRADPLTPFYSVWVQLKFLWNHYPPHTFQTDGSTKWIQK